jgi:hypothetical protein
MRYRKASLVASIVGAVVFSLSATGSAVSLFDIQGGNGQLRNHGQSVRVPVKYLCPTEENVSDGGHGVVIDLTINQVDKQGLDIEGEAESVPVICNDKWQTIVIEVQRDALASTGPAFIAGKAGEKGVLDVAGIDVATTPVGKDGSFTVRLRGN